MTILQRKPSPILAMHSRYEETMGEHRVVERAERNARAAEDRSKEYASMMAQRALTTESDALRAALLLQVPDTWPEALVLHYHLIVAFELYGDSDDKPEEERASIQTAIETLFDFMCSEVDHDRAALGSSFQDGASNARKRRRYRTGLVED